MAAKMNNKSKVDKVVPFQKAEKLAEHLWQQAPVGLVADEEDDSSQPDVIKRSKPRAVHKSYLDVDRYCHQHRHHHYDSVSKLSVPTTVMMMMGKEEEKSKPSADENQKDLEQDGEEGSPFVRDHHLRSSCPPPSRPRRQQEKRSKTPTRSVSGKASASYLEPAPASSSNAGSATGGGLVEKVQSKLKLGSVRKSWLFSLFNGQNSASSTNSNSSKVSSKKGEKE